MFTKSALLLLSAASIYAAGRFTPPVKSVPRVVQVAAPKPAFEDLLRTVPQVYGVPSVLARAVALKESAPWCESMDCVRFEPHHLKRGLKINKNPDMARAYASSHCGMQVMGWNAHRLGLKFSELYDPETCVEVGSKILAECLAKWRGKAKDNVDLIGKVGQCYNGSPEYGRDLVRRVSILLLEQSGEL